jgi:hypothetical protein
MGTSIPRKTNFNEFGNNFTKNGKFDEISAKSDKFFSHVESDDKKRELEDLRVGHDPV